ncbi:hypothetical protein [Paenibacillus chitinolyticus]
MKKLESLRVGGTPQRCAGLVRGHLEKDGQEYVFALNVEADMKANGSAARKIAGEVLRSMKLWN